MTMQFPADTLFTFAQIVESFHLTDEQTARLRGLLRGRAVRMPRRVKGEPWYRWTVVQQALATLHEPAGARGEPRNAKQRLAV